jgi:mRNA interferase RelE/StbE
MNYHVETTQKFDKQIKKLDKFIQYQVLEYLLKNIEGSSNPRNFGKGLKGNLAGSWRYRVGNYRIICQIQDKKLLILALEVGHRSNI